jgi:hypothetical protein
MTRRVTRLGEFSPIGSLFTFGVLCENYTQILETLEWKMLIYYTVTWNILRLHIWHIVWPFGKVVVIWYIFPVLDYCIKKNLANLVYHYLMFVWFKVIN